MVVWANRAARCVEFLGSRRVVVWSAALGVLLAAPSLWIGITADDHFLRTALLGYPDVPGAGGKRLDCFSFADGIPEHNRARIEGCLLPWWTPEDATLHFFRPLSALTHALDYRFLEPAWWAMHVHSLLWYGALCVAAGVLFRRTIAVPWIAGLAALLYAIDDAHGIPAGWLANRNACLTALFGVLALAAHDAWRRSGWRPGAVLAPVALAVGLGFGEGTLSVGGYLLAYALFLDRAGWKSRALSLTPYGVIGLVYLAYYGMAGYGAGGSALYWDPMGAPGAYLAAVARHLPALLHAQLGLLPSNIYPLLSPFWQTIHSLLGALALAVFAWLLLPLLRSDRVARFWALGMVLSALPVCATLPGERLLCLIGIGGMGLVAQFIGRGLACWNDGAPTFRRRLERAGVVFLVVTHGVIAPLSMPFSSVCVTIFGRGIEQGLAQLPDGPEVVEQSVVVLRAPVDVFATLMRPVRLTQGRPVPRHTWALTVGPAAVRATRIDRHTLDVHTEGGFLPFPYGTTFRGRQYPFKPGDVMQVEGFTAEVRSVTADARPEEVRFRFDVPLEDPSLRWYNLGPDGIEPYEPPSEGESTYTPAGSPMRWLLSKEAGGPSG